MRHDYRPSERPSARRRQTAYLALLLIGLLVPAARSTAAELSAEKAQAVDATVSAFVKERQVPGLSAALVVDGQVVLERGWGLADLENEVLATKDTVYRLASISKMLTAVAVMQLVEAGKLDLSAPIQTYVAKFPEKQAPITAELLLKHQSGIRHYKGNEVKSNVFYNRVGDALVIFQDDPLLFSPGQKFSYTTYGYCLLGTAIEGASGQEYVAYVQEHVCQPAGMKTIQPDNPYRIIPHRAAGYRMHGYGKKQELRNDFAVDVTNKIPGGGWCATPGDLARFAIALCDGRLVKPETLERMWTPQETASGVQTESGLGCFIVKVKDERRVFHSGGQPKVSTLLVLSPERREAVAVMCNLQNTNLQPLVNSLFDCLRGVKPEAAATHAAGSSR